MRIPHVQFRSAIRAFTAKDLVAVLACLSVLVMIQVPALGHGKGRNRLTQCLANLQQMGRAWLMYAEDNSGKVVWNPDGGDAGKVAGKPSWAGGWLDFSGPDGTNINLLINYTPPTSYGGLLGPYLPGASVFRCPEDPSVVTIFGQRKPRVRSISMNTYMGGKRTDGTLNSWSQLPFKTFLTVNDFSRLKPASAFVFVEEREESINDPVFAIRLSGALDLNDNITPGASLQIIDMPADWHDIGANLSFADGHAEYWRWTDPNLAQTRRAFSFSSGFATPGNPDFPRLLKATSSH